MQPLTPPDPSQKSKKFFPKVLKGAGIAVGAATLAGITGAAWWGWNFIQSDLAPTVQQDLEKRINRPLKIGDVESVEWGKITFGRSELPTYNKTVNGRTLRDQDHATVESVDVRFNPLQALTTRTVDLDVTLNNPEVFLDEDPDSRWVDLNLTTPEGGGGLTINVSDIHLKGGTVTLNPKRTAQRTLNKLNGSLNINPDQQQFNITGQTEIDSGGSIALQGRFLGKTQTLTLDTKSKSLNLPPLVGLLPEALPFEVKRGKLDGDVDITYRPNQPLSVDTNVAIKALDLYVPEEDAQLKAAQFKGKILLTSEPGVPIELKGEGQIKDGTGSIPEDTILSTGRSRRQAAKNVNGTIKFLGKNQRFWNDLSMQLPEGGDLKLSGVVSFLERRANLNVKAQKVPASLLDNAFQIPIQVRSGLVNSNLTINLKEDDRPSLRGTAQLKNIGAQITGLPESFNNTNGFLRFNGLTVTLDNLTSNYGNIPIIGNGSIDPDRGYNLRGKSRPIEVNKGLQTLGVEALPFPVGGEVIAEGVSVTGLIDDPVLQGNIRATRELTLDKVPVKQASVDFQVKRPFLKLSNIQATPTAGGSIKGQARYNLLGTEPWIATVDAEQIPGNAFVSYYGVNPAIELGKVSSQVKLEVSGDRYQLDMDLQAPEGAFPTTGSLTATPGRIDLKNIQTQVPGGKILASGNVIDGQINLNAQIPGINLLAFSEELRGELAGDLNIQAPLAGFSSQTAIAQGQVRLTEGISLIEDTITADIRWNGQEIEVQNATAPDFIARGTIGAILEGENAPQLTALDLDITKNNYALASLPFELPANSKLSGQADLTGKLSGQVYSPKLNSNVTVRNLIVNDLPFEPRLVGTLIYGAETGIDLKTRGSIDQVNLAINAQQEPKSFLVKNQDALATGRTVAPNQLAVELKQIPLTALNWDVVNDYGYGQVSGRATGSFQVALPTYDLDGPLVVTQPAIGPFKGDRFAGQFQIRDGIIAIKDSQLTQRDNRFLINAQLIPDTNPKFSGDLTIANAQIEDAIVALETLNFLTPQLGQVPTYGDAATITTVPVGEPQAPLILQLQRLAEINELKVRQQELQASLTQIPSWTELTGAITGQVNFKGSAETGINADFNLNSPQVQWDIIPIENVLASGSFRNNTLEFQELSMNSNGGTLAFQGKLGQENDGTLKISQLPLGELSLLLSPTLPVEGFLNAEASLAGSFDNPKIEGNLALSDTTINQTQIQTAQTQFNFEQARLNLAGFVDINTPDPVRFEGSIPYAFPFMQTQPTSDELTVKLQVKDEGLSLLNLFTDQLSWVDGAGEVDVAVLGTLSRPSIRGRINVRNATIDSISLPAPLTQVTGELNFNQERVQISKLQGSFSDGQLSATGSLPIFSQGLLNDASSPQRDSIFVNLDDLALDLKGLYRGGVQGDLQITGSVIAPNIGGRVALSDGQVVLSDATALSEGGDSDSGPIAINEPQEGSQPIQFNNLVVRLEDKVRILQPPLLNFSTEGQLTVNGSIDSPRPAGTVSFTKGELNLFTSFFRLNRRQNSFARFSPQNGLDPYLNVHLVTIVSEVNTGRNDRLTEFEDPLAGTLGSIESVRVKATVDGQASQLLTDLEQAIELTSSPNRSQGEIIALLSGGVAEAVQGGNTDLALANIASSAVLNRVQGVVDDAFGGRAVFRLFPVLIPNEVERSVLAFGSELGYDVTDDLSVSVLQVLTGTDDPTRFNISYDINDRFRARGSISIEGEATGLLEYRFRF